jgi:hypothetical protein
VYLNTVRPFPKTLCNYLNIRVRFVSLPVTCSVHFSKSSSYFYRSSRVLLHGGSGEFFSFHFCFGRRQVKPSTTWLITKTPVEALVRYFIRFRRLNILTWNTAEKLPKIGNCGRRLCCVWGHFLAPRRYILLSWGVWNNTTGKGGLSLAQILINLLGNVSIGQGWLPTSKPHVALSGATVFTYERQTSLRHHCPILRCWGIRVQ